MQINAYFFSWLIIENFYKALKPSHLTTKTPNQFNTIDKFRSELFQYLRYTVANTNCVNMSENLDSLVSFIIFVQCIKKS